MKKTDLEQIIDNCFPYIENGKLADYIPELAKADVNEFGICVMSDIDCIHCAGEFEKPAEPICDQDLVIAAVNEGMRQVDEESSAAYDSLTGGLNIPGL